MTPTRDWDATTYDRISAPQQAWAAEQLDRLALARDEVVLDAGCGSGKITLELVARVPRGRRCTSSSVILPEPQPASSTTSSPSSASRSSSGCAQRCWGVEMRS